MVAGISPSPAQRRRKRSHLLTEIQSRFCMIHQQVSLDGVGYAVLASNSGRQRGELAQRVPAGMACGCRGAAPLGSISLLQLLSTSVGPKGEGPCR